jgi:predicted  nucleic acid-binding Zn-ribbon protein
MNENGDWLKPIEPKQSFDPAPSPEAVAQERMSNLLASVTTTTLDQLRDLRDEIDSLMRAIQARNDSIADAFRQHVAYAANAIRCKEVIKESIGKIAHDFKNGLEPIAKTVTIQENKL